MDTVIYRAPYSDFFKTDTKVFLAVGFLVEVLQHLPDSRCRLIRIYSLYSSRARGTWFRQPHLVRLASKGWKRDHLRQPSVCVGPPEEPPPQLSVSAKQSRAAWARLIKKVCAADLPGGSRRQPAGARSVALAVTGGTPKDLSHHFREKVIQTAEVIRARKGVLVQVQSAASQVFTSY